METRSFLEPFPVRVTGGEVFRKYQFLTPCIGIFAGSEIWLGVANVAHSLMRNSFCHSNQSCKTFQYHRGTTRNRNIGSSHRVLQPHPAPRNLRFFGFGVSGTCRKLDMALGGHSGEKRPRARKSRFLKKNLRNIFSADKHILCACAPRIL